MTTISGSPLPRLRHLPLTAALVCAACYVGADGDGGSTGASETAEQSSSEGASASASTASGPGTAGSGDADSGGDSDSDSGLSAGSTGTSGESSISDGSASDGSTGGGSTGDATTTGDGTTTTGDGTTGDDTTGDSGGGDSGGGDDNTTPEGVCMRWNYDLSTVTPGSWTGSVAGCDAGDYVGGGKSSSTTLVNLYRWLADLPPVPLNQANSAKAQECALMMHANGTLSHSPPMSWKCYTADGASAAGKSNIATTAGTASVGLYMLDPGNPMTIGHRRWILSNSLGSVGIGSTSNYSCMWVIGGGGQGMNSFTAWPAPGPFPLAAKVDSTGWTVQSDSINLGNATVKVTSGGMDKPMKVTTLLGGYGSAHAISMIPQGWQSEAGKIYKVEVTGVQPPITYEVEFVDCN